MNYTVEGVNADYIAFLQTQSTEAGDELADESVGLVGGDRAGRIGALDVDLRFKFNV